MQREFCKQATQPAGLCRRAFAPCGAYLPVLRSQAGQQIKKQTKTNQTKPAWPGLA